MDFIVIWRFVHSSAKNERLLARGKIILYREASLYRISGISNIEHEAAPIRNKARGRLHYLGLPFNTTPPRCDISLRSRDFLESGFLCQPASTSHEPVLNRKKFLPHMRTISYYAEEGPKMKSFWGCRRGNRANKQCVMVDGGENPGNLSLESSHAWRGGEGGRESLVVAVFPHCHPHSVLSSPPPSRYQFSYPY